MAVRFRFGPTNNKSLEMAARNDVTGDLIKSRPLNNAYSDNWDAIFGKKKTEEVVEEILVPEVASEDHEDTTGQ